MSKVSRQSLVSCLLSLVLAAVALAVGAAEAQPTGAANAAGFYRVERAANGSWRLIDPAGNPTVWLGVDHVKFDGFRCEADGNRKHYREANERQFGTPEAWASNTVERLCSWGFNGLGAGCNNALFKGSGLGRCVFLAIGDSATAEKDDEEHWLSDNLHTPGTAFPNVFNPDFAEHCDREAEKACAPNRDDPEVLGYFIDNELAWDARRGGPAGYYGLFDAACAKPVGNTARAAVDAFLAERGLKVGDDIPIPVRMEFVEFTAEKYFEATTAAIRRHDPNHLVLGCRFAGTIYPDELWRAAGKFCDVISINGYARAMPDKNEILLAFRDSYLPIAESLAGIGELAGRPVMLTEWSFPAFDSGLPCLRGVGQRFDTQEERAWATALYARSVLSCPWVIGYDYFMWVDMPAKGISFRFPEDTNYGLVREDGTPYAEITGAFAAIQRRDGLSFDEWRKAIATRGPLEPPPWTPNPREDVLDAVVGSQCHLSASPSPPPSFERGTNGEWRATNAGWLELRGSLVELAPPFAILCGGFDYGSLSASLTTRDGRTLRVERVAAADWRTDDDGRGILSLDCDLGAARMALEVRIAPERTTLHIDLRGIENTGDALLDITEIAFLPIPTFGEPTVPPKAPHPMFMNRPRQTRAWIDHATGRSLNVMTDSHFANGIDFRLDADGTRHSIVRFSPTRPAHGSRKLLIAPGETWTPEAPIHILVTAR